MYSPMKKVINKQLGELLIEHGIINTSQLEKALAVQKEKGGLDNGAACSFNGFLRSNEGFLWSIATALKRFTRMAAESSGKLSLLYLNPETVKSAGLVACCIKVTAP